MPRRRLSLSTSLFLCAALAFTPAITAQDSPSPLLGTWTGEVHHDGESKLFGFRFAMHEKYGLCAFAELPDLKFHNLGPFPVRLTNDTYKADDFSFTLASDHSSISGKWIFDGNELTFELHPGPLPPAVPAAPAAGRLAEPAWTFKTGGPIWSSPALAADAVYIGSNDANLYALALPTGKLLWNFKTAAPVVGAPSVDGDFVYALSDDGFLYKFNRHKGSLVWKFDTNGGAVPRELPNVTSNLYDTVASSPLISGGIVYIGSADKRLYALDARSGHELWRFETQGMVRSTPAVDSGRLFFGSRDHFLYALDAATGKLLWKHDTLREIVSSPLVANGTVYVGSRSSNLFAFEAATGALKWKFFYWSSWVESSARIRDGILYIGSSDSQQLYAISAASGSLVWSFGTDGSPWSTPAVTQDRVYIGVAGVPNYFIAHHGGFFAVERSTGEVAWRFPMPEIPGADTYGVAASPAVGNGLVFFGGLDGVLYAFRT